MSATLIPSAGMRQSTLARPSAILSYASSASDSFVDVPAGPFSSPSSESLSESNPVSDLIPDDLFRVLRSHDLISEKGIRDHIIRRAFKSMRDEQALKSSEALERLQAIYPYLQIDTIRKIIYRIGPGCHRKAML